VPDSENGPNSGSGDNSGDGAHRRKLLLRLRHTLRPVHKKSGKIPAFLLQSLWLLFLKQRLNVETLVRDNFTQAAQGFDLDLTHAFARQTNFAAHIF